MSTRNRSISIQLAAMIVVITTVIVGIYAVSTSLIFYNRETAKLHDRLAVDADQLHTAIAAALWNFDTAQVDKLLDGCMKDKTYSGIVVKSAGTVYSRSRNERWETVAIEPTELPAETITHEQPIVYTGQQLGTLYLSASPRFLHRELATGISYLGGSILLLDVVLVFSLYGIIDRMVLQPLKKLKAYAVAVSTGDVEDTSLATVAFNGEMEGLRSALAQMVTLLESRYFELRQEAKRFSATFEQAAVGFALVAPEGRWLRVNQRLCDIVGYSRDELYSKTFQDITYPDDLETDLAFVGQMVAGKITTYSMQKRYIRKEGSLVWINLTVSLVRDDLNTPEYFISVIEDISEWKQADAEIHRLNADLEQRVADRTAQLQAANREMESFAYSVSHDLRAPLRSIDGFSLALLEDYASTLDEKAHEYLRRVRAATQKMAQLIDDILKLSRVTRSELTIEPVNLSAMAVSIAEELHNSAPERKVTFVIAEGITIRGDTRLLKLVLENIMGNSWKYTSKHSAARIELGVTDINGKPTCFIRDDGAGFEMKYADKLFITFQRLHSEQEFPGTGVGLALVQHIIHRHGGTIWAEGAVEQGATFYFTVG